MGPGASADTGNVPTSSGCGIFDASGTNVCSVMTCCAYCLLAMPLVCRRSVSCTLATCCASTLPVCVHVSAMCRR